MKPSVSYLTPEQDPHTETLVALGLPLTTLPERGGAIWRIFSPAKPRRFFAEPRIHSGRSAEIDVTTYEKEDERDSPTREENGNGGVATAVATAVCRRGCIAGTHGFPQVYDQHVHRAIAYIQSGCAEEIPGNQQGLRPEHRPRLFAAKCAGFFESEPSVVIVDLVTTRRPEILYAELLDLIGKPDPLLNNPEPPPGSTPPQ